MPGDFAKLNLTITAGELNAAWQDRLDDAAVLEAGGRYGAAIAARLYALEIYLKFRICERLRVSNPLKKLEIHDLEALLLFSGLSAAMYGLPETSAVFQNWEEIRDFSGRLNDLRYFPAVKWNQRQSSDFAHWLEHPSEGVLSWLKTQA